MDTSDPQLVTELPVEYLFDCFVDFDPGILIFPSPFGMRLDAIAAGGKARGPRLNGDVLPGGGDWLTMAGTASHEWTFGSPSRPAPATTSTARAPAGPSWTTLPVSCSWPARRSPVTTRSTDETHLSSRRPRSPTPGSTGL